MHNLKVKNTVFVLFLITFFGCDFKPSNQEKNNSSQLKLEDPKINSDTFVEKIVYPMDSISMNYLEKKYFVINGKDTSSFSLTTVLNVSSENFIFKLHNSINNNLSILSINDTISAVDLEKPNRSLTNYTQQTKELKMIFNSFGKEYNFNKLSAIRFSIMDISGLSELILKQLNSNFKKTNSTINNKKIKEILNSSFFIKDLNDILEEYNLFIDEIFYEGLGYVKPENSADEVGFAGSVILSIELKNDLKK